MWKDQLKGLIREREAQLQWRKLNGAKSYKLKFKNLYIKIPQTWFMVVGRCQIWFQKIIIPSFLDWIQVQAQFLKPHKSRVWFWFKWPWSHKSRVWFWFQLPWSYKLQFGLQYLEIALSALWLSTGEPSNIGYNKIKEPPKQFAMDPTCRFKWVQWLPLPKVHLDDHINDGSSTAWKEKEEKISSLSN